MQTAGGRVPHSPPHIHTGHRPYTALTRLTSRVYCSESTASPLLLLFVLGGELGVGLLLVRVRVRVRVGLGCGSGFPSKGWSRPPSFHSPEREGFLVTVRARVRARVRV